MYGIQDSLRFWIAFHGFRIPIVSRIPDPLSCILDSKAQDSGFHEQNFPEFRILHVKIFSDSGIRIPLRTRGETDRVWKPPSGGSREEARGTRPSPPPPFLLFLVQTEARTAEKKTAPSLTWRPATAIHGLLTFFSFPCLSKTGGTSGSCGCSSSSWPKNHKSTYTGI